MQKLAIDQAYVVGTLVKLLRIPSPSGYTDRIVHYLCHQLEELGL